MSRWSRGLARWFGSPWETSSLLLTESERLMSDSWLATLEREMRATSVEPEPTRYAWTGYVVRRAGRVVKKGKFGKERVA